jgi:tRNA(Ile)-lysidine synthase
VAWAHYNHRWSAWGDEAEAFVRAQAELLGVTLHVGHGGGKAPSNAEAQARAARLAFFHQLCTAHGYAGVLLAHTQTDVAETFLMRAGKGSGVRGLAALAPETVVGGVRIGRPLLGVAREALRAWLMAQGQPWLDDPDTQNQRARVRALLPQLAAAGVPVHGLAAAAQAAARAQAAVAAQVQAFRAMYPATVPVAALVTLPAEVAGQVLGEIIAAQAAGGEVVRTSKRLALLARLAAQPAGQASLGGLVWQWRAGTLTWRQA